MANPEHLAILKQGVEVWNQWRFEAGLREPDLQEIDIANCNLAEANFYRADLRRAKLTSVDLSRADLRYSRLDYSHFGGCEMTEANLLGASAEEVDFTGWEGEGTSN